MWHHDNMAWNYAKHARTQSTHTRKATANTTDDGVCMIMFCLSSLCAHTQTEWLHTLSESLLLSMKGVEIQELQSLYVCVCVCVCARVRVSVCVCVCSGVCCTPLAGIESHCLQLVHPSPLLSAAVRKSNAPLFPPRCLCHNLLMPY